MNHISKNKIKKCYLACVVPALFVSACNSGSVSSVGTGVEINNSKGTSNNIS